MDMQLASKFVDKFHQELIARATKCLIVLGQPEFGVAGFRQKIGTQLH